MRRGRTTTGLALLVTSALVGGCSGDRAPAAASEAATGAAAADGAAVPHIDVGGVPRSAFDVFGSIGQANLVGATAGVDVALVDARGAEVARSTSDDGGSLIVYDVAPGAGYRFVELDDDGAPRTASAPFAVTDRDDDPPTSLHTGQALQQGLNYVRMRDGVTLAMTVRLPPGAALDDGPFPTVIEYSGYPTAAPNDLLASITATMVDPDAPEDPLAPSTATVVGSIIAPLLGFATVSVQMRGTGCSGGAFDLFGLPSIYDGYDAVETVAAQPWVKGHKVGMVGISYSGYSQLFVGGTRPPSLAALAPMSVTADLYDGIGFPGGIYNTGFAKGWLTERAEDAKAAPGGGQRWATARIEAGDEQCLRNQRLHRQAPDLLATLDDTEFRTPALFADRTPATWAERIDVPTFLVGGLQDEQLGSHWVEVIEAFDDNPDTWVTMFNGLHDDALQPDVLERWVEFLHLFVADEVPAVADSTRALAGVLVDRIAGVAAAPLDGPRFEGTDDVESARARFRRDARIRVLAEVGGGDLGPGALQPTWEMTGPSWPLPGTVATRWHLGADGALTTRRPPRRAVRASYTADPGARPETSHDPDVPQPYPGAVNNWTPVAEGRGLGWVSAPLDDDVVIAGTSSLDLWVTATARDTDLQATLSEVRPDGDETYLTTGWLRASHRVLDDRRSTELDPHPTHLARDDAPLRGDDPVLVRIPIHPVVHAFRAGSRIRVTLQAPGGDRPTWKHRTIDDGDTQVTVTSSAASPSSLVLAVVADRRAGAPLPACGSLRGQPCRRYVPAANGG